MSLVKIINLYLEDIDWHTPAYNNFNINGHTDIWRISISANLPFQDTLSKLINAAGNGTR